jgi:hypothetical protein
MDFKVIVGGMPVTRKSGEVLQCALTATPQRYWLRNRLQEMWNPITEPQLNRILKECGLSGQRAKGDDISELEEGLIYIGDENRIDYAISLAGYREGRMDRDGKVLLITQSCKPLPAVEGDWAVLRTFMEGLFGEQVLDRHLAWWKWARMSLTGEQIMPGQVMIYVGLSGAGKSFLQKMTTALLGGHASNPFLYMSGQSSFNSDLFKSEHLVIEDQSADTGGLGRRAFGSKLKELVVNQVISCHGKGADATTLRPKWRVSMSMNPGRENMMILPPLDASILDKIMLIQCTKTDWFEAEIKKGWERWGDLVASQLPALAHAIDTFEIPESLKHERYGVKPWHDKLLVEFESETSIEQQFLECVLNDLGTVMEGDAHWEGKSSDLSRIMLGNGMPSCHQVRGLLKWHGAAGSYLGTLSTTRPEIVTSRKVNGSNVWRIQLPTT